MIVRICAFFKAKTRGRAWKAIINRHLKPCNQIREDHNQKFSNGIKRTNVGKYSFVYRNIKSWNQIPAGLLASFSSKLNTYRKRVKNVLKERGLECGLSVNNEVMLSVVMWSELT
jgi:hypothetical protein